MKTPFPSLRRRLRVGVLVLSIPVMCGLAQEDVRINEVDSDTPGTDTLEFVELFDGGIGNTPLDGLVLVFFNGSNDASYAAFDLDGLVTSADGFFVVGNPLVPNVGLSFDPGGQGFLQNGADAVALYLGNAVDFPNGTGLATSGLIDAVVYDTNDADDVGLLAGLAPAGITLVQLDEAGNANGANEALARVPDGGMGFDGAAYSLRDPTPGVSNVLQLEISLFPASTTLSESGALNATEVMVLLDGPPASDLTVTLANPDVSELSVPVSIVIPAGMTEGSFTATAVDDAWPDGDRMVTLTASGVGYFDGIVTITVQDDGDPDPGIVVNEIYASVDSGGGDANQDGIAGDDDGSDEFVEIVNTTVANVDISGLTLSDFATVRHTFPPNTVLEPMCAVVVFGGGNVPEGRLAAFGGAIVQKANGSNTFGLSLNDAGDLVAIRDPANGNLEVAGHVFGMSGSTAFGVTTSMGSIARDPDLTGAYQFRPHTAGYSNDGFLVPFCPVPPQLSAMLPVATVGEDAGSVTLELSVPSAPGTALTIHLASSHPNVATVPAAATIAGGATSTDVTVMVLDNAFENGPIAVTLTADALGHLSGSAVLTVTDDGDPAVHVAINEVDYDPVGTDVGGAEFVELYDGGIGNLPLDGYVLVFYNGNAADDGEYRIIDLGGAQTDGSGFYVVTTPQDGIQNGGTGGDALALYRGASAVDFEGTVPGGAPPGAELVDALVYEAGDGNLIAPLGYAGPDLTDNGSADGISRLPDGTGVFQLAPLTRGFSNSTDPGTGYDQWATGFPGLGGPLDDDDHDSLVNFIEYLLGKNPTLADAASGIMVGVNGGGNPQLTLAKGPEAGADAGLIVEVEVSTGMTGGSWTTADTNVLTDDSTSLVVEYTGDAPDIFLRATARYP